MKQCQTLFWCLATTQHWSLSSVHWAFLNMGNYLLTRLCCCDTVIDSYINYRWPPLGSRIVFELWTGRDSNDGYVRVLLNGKDYTDAVRPCRLSGTGTFSTFFLTNEVASNRAYLFENTTKHESHFAQFLRYYSSILQPWKIVLTYNLNIELWLCVSSNLLLKNHQDQQATSRLSLEIRFCPALKSGTFSD